MIRRSLAAVAADVYCLQEEYTNTGGFIGQTLHDLDPQARWWSVEKSRDLAIASHFTLTPLPEDHARILAVGVNAPEPFVVINYHGSCCGHTGTEEDLNRALEVEEIAAAVEGLRGGPFDGAPVIVTGDFNLVGHPQVIDPLRLPQDQGGLGLTWLKPRHLQGADTWTWRKEESRYAPGTLDLLFYDAAQLDPVKSFVLYHPELDPQERQSLGLLEGDQMGADHLLVVVDLLRR